MRNGEIYSAWRKVWTARRKLLEFAREQEENKEKRRQLEEEKEEKRGQLEEEKEEKRRQLEEEREEKRRQLEEEREASET